MRFRKLRIAWSVGWLRGYSTRDLCSGIARPIRLNNSIHGRLMSALNTSPTCMVCKRARQDSNLQPLVPTAEGDDFQSECDQALTSNTVDSCTTGRTTSGDSHRETVEILATDLRRRLSADECRRLRELLIKQ
jgi:hypothetical protein